MVFTERYLFANEILHKLDIVEKLKQPPSEMVRCVDARRRRPGSDVMQLFVALLCRSRKRQRRSSS